MDKNKSLRLSSYNIKIRLSFYNNSLQFDAEVRNIQTPGCTIDLISLFVLVCDWLFIALKNNENYTLNRKAKLFSKFIRR